MEVEAIGVDGLIDALIEREGGYVNHPADKGGPTCFGITEDVARANGFAGPMRSLPRDEAAAIYRRLYWLRPRFDQVAKRAPRVAAELFDTGVNMGPAVAATFLQRALTALNRGGRDYPDLTPDGRVGPEVQAALANPTPVTPLVPNGGDTRVEVDLRRQLLFLYKDGALHLITHVSTGNGKNYCVDGSCNNRAITPIGSFRFAWRYSGWRESRLGRLYNPVYFTSSGVAVHGALSVPTVASRCFVDSRMRPEYLPPPKN